jgi:hypothetical protein
VGLFSSSKSSSSTSIADQRVAVQDGIGLSGSNGNNVSMTTTDYGSVARAFDSIDKNNALTAGSFEALLGSADKLWQTGERLVAQTSDRVADAYNLAQTDAKGTIDNKTIVVLAVAACVTAAAIAYAKYAAK